MKLLCEIQNQVNCFGAHLIELSLFLIHCNPIYSPVWSSEGIPRFFFIFAKF